MKKEGILMMHLHMTKYQEIIITFYIMYFASYSAFRHLIYITVSASKYHNRDDRKLKIKKFIFELQFLNVIIARFLILSIQ